MNTINRLQGETEEQFCKRLYRLKDSLELTWVELADILNDELGYSYSPDKYRKDAYKYLDEKLEDFYDAIPDAELDADILEMKIERTKLADERSQVNALYRRIAREDSIKEIAHDMAEQFAKNLKLSSIKPTSLKSNKKSKYKGLLLVSDWHYGIDIDNIFNKYNPEIAKQRIQQLQEETIIRCKEKGITELTVINLGDLIAGNIHLPLRINSRLDVMSQIMEVSELYAEMLANLSQHFHITTYSVLDNHSRIDPNKDTSLQLESLARITDWFLKERLKDCNVDILDNSIDTNIATFEIDGYKILGVHGDLDKQNKLVDSLTSFTQQHYDLIVSAHMHHFSTDEKNNTMVICNGSLMATDDYAFKLRLNSYPSQTLIMISDKSVCDEIHRIVLD